MTHIICNFLLTVGISKQIELRDAAASVASKAAVAVVVLPLTCSLDSTLQFGMFFFLPSGYLFFKIVFKLLFMKNQE